MPSSRTRTASCGTLTREEILGYVGFSPAPATRRRRASSAGRASCWPSTPTSAGSSPPTRASSPTPSRRSCASKPPSPVQARYVTTRRRAPRTSRGAGGQRHGAAQRVGQPRRAQVRRPRPLRHPPRASSHHMSFGYGTALLPRAPLWPGSRGGSRWTRCSSASPTGRSTTEHAVQARTSTVRGWETLPVFTR